ncbi:MAG: response regulator [Verrucomicrobiota bacterium]
MHDTHSLLKRQLKRFFGPGAAVPESLKPFVSAVNESYHGFDDDRAMLERSLELSSQELLQANSQMRALFQGIPDLLFRLDEHGTILDVRTGSSRDLLLPQQTFVGRRFQAVADPGLAARFEESIRQVARERKIVRLEYPLAVQGGSSTYEARFSPLLENEVLVIVRNIDDRKRSESELRHTVSLLKSTLESTADGLLVVDHQGRIASFNRQFIKLFQLPPGLLEAGDDAPVLAHVTARMKDPEAFLRRVRELYADFNAESFDVLEFQDGRTVERYSCPQRLDGVPVGRVWSFSDITVRRELEEQLLQSQKMEAFGQLAAGVAHDFNNILTVILGNASLLQSPSTPAALKASASGEVVRAAERAANLTRQLLTFSRRQPLQARDLDLNDVVANISKMLRRLIGEHIALETRCAPGGAPIHVDPGMMEQILMNLAVNSRDAMPKGGRLLVETAQVTLDPAQVHGRQNARPGNFVQLSVTDTGCGIAPDMLPYIFEPFFTTKEVGKGTGLGLATVFGIVQQHHGWIEVESRLNVGTSFHVFLPRLSHTLDTSIQTLDDTTAPGGKERILVVEDEPSVRQLIQAVLETHGYHVHTEPSGASALREWDRYRGNIDLVITDMVMPEGVSGRELAEKLRSDSPGLKIIFCSGYAEEMLDENSDLLTREHFLEKPFEPRKLLEHIRTALN